MATSLLCSDELGEKEEDRERERVSWGERLRESVVDGESERVRKSKTERVSWVETERE